MHRKIFFIIIKDLLNFKFMDNIRIFTPVIGTSIEKFLENLEKTQQISDYIELRVDTIENLAKSELMSIKKALKKEAIFTCRKNSEGGFFSGEENKRVDILQKALDLHFECVDIEFSTIEEYTLVSNHRTKIIISYHNLNETPSYWDLNKIILRIKQHKPDIVKIATMINEEYERTKIYRLLTNKSHEEKRIVLGLGFKGKITRILAPLLGSYLTYASTPYSTPQPEDVGLNDLKEIYHQLGI